MIDIRQPNITAKTEQEQVMQIRSYLYSLSQQLQFAFNYISSGGSGGTESVSTYRTPGGNAASGQGGLTNFAEIKSLIIKSADIVEAYSEKIGMKLSGLYVARSDFGAYQEKTSQEIQANSSGLQQVFQNSRDLQATTEQIQADVTGKTATISRLETAASDTANNLKELENNAQVLAGKVNEVSAAGAATAAELEQVRQQIIDTNAYVKTGLLYEKADGTPVYGLEIGQTNSVNGQTVFQKFSRFTPDRLSFYNSSGTEVAYVSDYKLYITNAEITGALWLAGRFKIFYDNGLAFQWTGGNG